MIPVRISLMTAVNLYRNRALLLKSYIMEDLKLTGISLGYDNNLIYECSDPQVMDEFKAYLDSSEVKRVDKVLLWFESAGKNIFLVAEPRLFQDCNDEWIVTSEDIPGFSFRHKEGNNLFEEITEQVSSFILT